MVSHDYRTGKGRDNSSSTGRKENRWKESPIGAQREEFRILLRNLYTVKEGKGERKE